MWGVSVCFGGALSVLGFSSILMKAVVSMSFPFGGIDHDLATNKFVETRTVLGQGVSSLVSGMAAEVVAGALGCKGVGCCSIRGLVGLGINGTSSSSWDFYIEDLGIFWILHWVHCILSMVLGQWATLWMWLWASSLRFEWQLQ